MEDNRHVAIETVTPEQAAAWLDDGAPNRNKKLKQATYQRDMEADRWTWDSLIKFNADGRLVDGFNRLRAQVEAGVTVEYIVARGAFQKNTDTGTPRKFADELRIKGYTDPELVAYAVSWHRFFEYPDQRYAVKSGRGKKTYINLSISELEAELDDMNKKHWERFMPQARRLGKTLHTSASLWLVLLMRTHEFLEGDAAPFFEELETGEGNLLNVRLLRDRLLENAAQAHPASTTERLVWITKAWNGYMTGTRLSQLRWTTGGRAPEAFPELITKP